MNNAPPRVTTGWNSAETYSIDGYGTLIVHGNSYECLRVRSVEVENFTYQGFNYFTKSGVSFLVSSTKDQNDTGIVKVTGITTINNLGVTLVRENGFIPTTLSLSQNYPNPFNPSTMIQFTVPSNGRAVLKVFNVLGQEVATLFNGEAAAGVNHQVEFNASNLASGVYFSRLEFGGTIQMNKMLLLK